MYRVEPWGDDWQQAALIMTLLTRGPLKKKFTTDDFIPWRKTRKAARQTASQMMGVFKAFAAFHNARIANKQSGAK